MNLKRISVKLAWMLRHCQTPRYIDLNGGWADVDVIIKALKERYPDFDRKTLELIVAQDEKGRYSFEADDAAVRAYLPRLRNRRQGRQKTRQARDTKDPRKRFQERRQRAVPLLKRRMAGKGCTAGIF